MCVCWFSECVEFWIMLLNAICVCVGDTNLNFSMFVPIDEVREIRLRVGTWCLLQEAVSSMPSP